MRKKLQLLFLCAPLLGGCASTLTALRSNQGYHFEEIKTELADLRHSLHGTEVEVKLLEERLDSQDAESPKGDVSSLQKKISQLEKTVDKMSGELHSLMSYANQTTASLAHYRDQILEIDRKLSEVGKLRSTLSQISKTYSSPAAETYLVKSGDSLEKIARKFHVSIEALKRENKLSSDKIVVGQELAIPAGAQ